MCVLLPHCCVFSGALTHIFVLISAKNNNVELFFFALLFHTFIILRASVESVAKLGEKKKKNLSKISHFSLSIDKSNLDSDSGLFYVFCYFYFSFMLQEKYENFSQNQFALDRGKGYIQR